MTGVQTCALPIFYAKTVKEVDAKRKAFVRKWRLKCQAVVDSLDEAGPRLFTFLRYPPEQWKSIRTTDVIDKRNLHCGALGARIGPASRETTTSHAREATPPFDLGPGGAMMMRHGRPRGEEQGARRKPRRAAFIVAPRLRRPCAPAWDHADSNRRRSARKPSRQIGRAHV